MSNHACTPTTYEPLNKLYGYLTRKKVPSEGIYALTKSHQISFTTNLYGVVEPLFQSLALGYRWRMRLTLSRAALWALRIAKSPPVRLNSLLRPELPSSLVVIRGVTWNLSGGVIFST